MLKAYNSRPSPSVYASNGNKVKGQLCLINTLTCALPGRRAVRLCVMVVCLTGLCVCCVCVVGDSEQQKSPCGNFDPAVIGTDKRVEILSWCLLVCHMHTAARAFPTTLS